MVNYRVDRNNATNSSRVEHTISRAPSINMLSLIVLYVSLIIIFSHHQFRRQQYMRFEHLVGYHVARGT